MLKIAIVGCGKIADQHAEQIGYIEGCALDAVCDSEELMALQVKERFGIRKHYADIDKMLGEARPDVVHITTPPGSHLELGRRCLEAGCHVFMEKPFTVNTEEALSLLNMADSKGLKMTVGHNAQFTPAALRMRELVGQGFLGGAPVHLESYYCYNLSDTAYAKALLGDKGHWVRQLPGRLLHNIINHGISKIAEFLPGDAPSVVAVGRTGPLLRNMGETDIVDELRVIVQEGDTTAYFTFSTSMSPTLHQLRIYGPKNGLVVDDDQQTVIKLRGARMKSYLEQFLPPLTLARQYLSCSLDNMRLFLRNEFQSGYGMRYLFESFYRAIKDGSPLPIPYREILLTSHIMDDIFVQVRKGSTLPAGATGGGCSGEER